MIRSKYQVVRFRSNIYSTFQRLNREEQQEAMPQVFIFLIFVGSVVSDSFNYTKGLNFDSQGHLYWQLVANDRGYKNLTIFNRMRIKRMEPFNETDLSSLEDILDHATVQISPGTV